MQEGGAVVEIQQLLSRAALATIVVGLLRELVTVVNIQPTASVV